MPVTARLSRAFYERLGDEIANELVAWFNAVDLTYRTELRELNDLNFARFDAKMGERLAALKTELRSELLTYMDTRFTRLEDGIRDARISGIKWAIGFWSLTILVLIGVFLKG